MSIKKDGTTSARQLLNKALEEQGINLDAIEPKKNESVRQSDRDPFQPRVFYTKRHVSFAKGRSPLKNNDAEGLSATEASTPTCKA